MSAPVACPIEVIDRLLSAQDKELVDRVIRWINETLSRVNNLKPVFMDVPQVIVDRQDLLHVITWHFLQTGWAVKIRETATDLTWRFSLVPDNIYE